MKNLINIAVVGLGQVGIYLLNELNNKKLNIENNNFSVQKSIKRDKVKICLMNQSF